MAYIYIRYHKHWQFISIIVEYKTSNVNFDFQRLMEQLIVNKPSDPLAFLVEQLKKENDDGM